jgi:DNA-directed RNA polymerase specialized sigma24 family protein
MLESTARADSFTDFVRDVEPRLRHSLIPVVGLDAATDATAAALAYGWEHWDRLRVMDNPAGYLYRVARTKARRATHRSSALPAVSMARLPDVEPGLPAALAYAVLGIAGSYGVNARPLDDDLTTFAVRRQPADAIREISADEEVAPGLTAIQTYRMSGYGALPASNPLRVVLLVGSDDQYTATNDERTEAFAEALGTHGIDVEIVIVPDADHADVIRPRTDGGQATLVVIGDLPDDTP